MNFFCHFFKKSTTILIHMHNNTYKKIKKLKSILLFLFLFLFQFQISKHVIKNSKFNYFPNISMVTNQRILLHWNLTNQKPEY